MREVQSFITNISFPYHLDEFLFFLEDNFHFNVDDVLNEDYLEWTAPRWCKIGDIVFFMHAKTAIQKITRIRTEYNNTKNNYTTKQQKLIEKGINHALDNYKKYGGKIYAIGQVTGSKLYDDLYPDDVKLHWGSKIYAPISEIFILENPIDISEFKDFIMVSRQSAITGIFGKEYEELKKIIIEKNNCPEYFVNSISAVLPIREINKYNWLSLSNEFRRAFFLESQFRSYYTDYLLNNLSDGKVYKECRCKKHGKPDCFVDNIIELSNSLLLVEIKLDINNEADLPGQIKKYCDSEQILLEKDTKSVSKFINNIGIIIDTNNVYKYDKCNNSITSIFDLDMLKTKEDIKTLKYLISESINKSANK